MADLLTSDDSSDDSSDETSSGSTNSLMDTSIDSNEMDKMDHIDNKFDKSCIYKLGDEEKVFW